MDIETFEELVDRHGGDLSRWPRQEGAAAEALLATSAVARARLEEMREVETVLRDSSVVDAPDAVPHTVERTVARATRHAQETRARRVALRAGAGMAAAAVLALGVLVGGLLPAPAPRDLTADRVLAAAFDSGGAGDVE